MMKVADENTSNGVKIKKAASVMRRPFLFLTEGVLDFVSGMD